MASIFRIVLRDAKRYDTYETREFDLPLNAEFPIGRASSNISKRDLMAAPHNAYIDSPVISRQHAVLSASSTSGVPEVYITDKGSMHGTTVNSQRLPANKPTKLNVGDVLQFGTDVNRNEEFFVARTYTFESQLSRPFSLGFTVPDPESDDEEVAERRGSQIDPFVIDDSDGAEDQSEEGDQEDVTMMMEQVLHQSEPVHSFSPAQEEYPESAMRTTIVNEDYDEEDKRDARLICDFTSHRDDSLVPASPNASSQGQDDDAIGTDSDSEAGSIGSSEIMSDSEPEIQDSDDEEMDETDHNKPNTSSTNKENEPSGNATTPRTLQCSMQNPSTLSLRDVYMLDDAANGQASLPRIHMFGMQGSDNNPMSNSNVYAESAPPPLPPRPSTSRVAPWCNPTYPTFPSQSDLQDWYSEDMSQPNYLGTNFGDRPSLFSPAPPPSAPESAETRAPMYHFSNCASQSFQANRLQTPPPMPASDVETATPLQPGRRTKVSIEEIVEEQPPTPESVNNMKRKADVLEAEEPAAALDETPKVIIGTENANSESVVAVPAADAAAIQTAAIIAQRPKKTPRSILSKVLDKAAYPLLGATGAVVSFALLSTLPDTFFV